MRAPRQAIKGYQGEGLITDCVYYLPLLDADGNIQVVRAHGVDEITTVTRTRLPHVAREIFPAIRAYMPWMETGAGHVELLIGVDNRQWLPAHVEDSWSPDDDMRLMRSAFGYRFMITDGWGRDLFPPEDPQGEPGGAAGGDAEAPEETEGVRLEEYQGWSRGTWSREAADARETPGDGNPGACNGGRGGTATRGASAFRGRPNLRGGSRGGYGPLRDPGVPPAPFGMPHSQVKWWMLLRPKREIPPPPPEEGRPPTLHPCNCSRAGVGGAGVGEVEVEPPDPHSREDSPLLTLGECRDYCSRQGQWTRCRDWPS